MSEERKGVMFLEIDGIRYELHGKIAYGPQPVSVTIEPQAGRETELMVSILRQCPEFTDELRDFEEFRRRLYQALMQELRDKPMTEKFRPQIKNLVAEKVRQILADMGYEP